MKRMSESGKNANSTNQKLQQFWLSQLRKRTMRMVVAVGLAMRLDTYPLTAHKTVETVERVEAKVDVDVVEAVAVAKVDVVARVAKVDPRSENPAGNVKKLLDTTSPSPPKVTFPVGCG